MAYIARHMAALLKQLAGETAIYGLSSILGRLLHFVILTPYLTRVLSQASYGIYTDLYFWAGLLLVLLTFRMETTFFRYGRDKDARAVVFSTASWGLWLFSLVFAALALVFAGPIAEWLAYPDHEEYVRWFALIIALDALAALPLARLRLESRPMRFALVRITGMLVNIGMIFFFLEGLPVWKARGWFGFLPEADKLGYIFLANLVASALVLLLLLPTYRRIRLQFSWRHYRMMLIYATPLVLAGVAGVTNQMIGAPMLKWLASDDIQYNLAQAGIYGAAAKLAVFMNLFTQAFNYAAEPFFFRLADQTKSRETYGQVAQAFALVGCLVFLGILFYLDLIQYFLGADFRVGLDIVPILLLANLMLGMYYNFSIWFKLADRTRVGGWIALGGSVIVLAVNALLIPRYGYFGPAIAVLACYTFMSAAGYLSGRHAYPISYPLGKIAYYLAVALSGYALSLWLAGMLPEMPVRLGVNTLLLALCTTLMLWPDRKLARQWLKRTK